MNLHDLGWDDDWRRELDALGPDLEPARVAVEHRINYEVFNAQGTARVELSNRLRQSEGGHKQRPAVGDWVGLRAGYVEGVLPRRSVFRRKAAGERAEAQVIAANIDVVFVVTSANRDFNPRRIERYLAAVREGGAAPVLVLNKADLCDDLEALLSQLGAAREGLPVACVSALEQRGKEELTQHIRGHRTAVLAGMSGVGKSSIANWLLGSTALATGAIRAGDERGMHTTSHRSLFVLPGGGVLIDTPGMRELGVWSEDSSLPVAFPDIVALARECRFADCKHAAEPGCAIRAALDGGTLKAERLTQFRQLRGELLERAAPTLRKPRNPRRRGRT